jgi:hypothetical protein
MRVGFRSWMNVTITAIAYLSLVVIPGLGQNSPVYKPARTPDGKPDISGIWQAMNEANWNVEAHAAAPAAVVANGAMFAMPPGAGVVEGGEIPYLPDARKKQQANFAERMKLDPENKCYMGGIPRATYMPYPFQIVQNPKTILFAYEYAGAVRSVNMGAPTNPPADSWMGWSNGRWEGDTLVIDVKGLNDQTWFDRAGNYHSDALHVTERYTPRSPDTLTYEATIEDPKTFSRPWKISMPLYRRVEKDAHLMEFKCVEFSEEFLYGHLRRGAAQNTGK